jgi:hypothetical protein
VDRPTLRHAAKAQSREAAHSIGRSSNTPGPAGLRCLLLLVPTRHMINHVAVLAPAGSADSPETPLQLSCAAAHGRKAVERGEQDERCWLCDCCGCVVIEMMGWEGPGTLHLPGTTTLDSWQVLGFKKTGGLGDNVADFTRWLPPGAIAQVPRQHSGVGRRAGAPVTDSAAAAVLLPQAPVHQHPRSELHAEHDSRMHPYKACTHQARYTAEGTNCSLARTTHPVTGSRRRSSSCRSRSRPRPRCS